MKKLTLFLLALFFFLSCSEKSAEKKEEAKPVENSTGTSTGTYTDYIDKGITIAVEIGDVYDKVAENLFKAGEIPKYSNVPDMLEALRTNKVDAVLISDDYVKQLMDSGIYKDIEYLLVPKDVFVNEVGSIFHTTQLRDKYNGWFDTITKDGTLEKVKNRWLGVSLPEQEDIPQFELTAKNGTLKVGGSVNYPPLEYLDANGKIAGYQAELVYRFAQHLGMDVEVANMSYEAVGAYIISGKADMSLSSFAITDERKQSMIFGRPSIIKQAVLIVPKKTIPKETESFTRFKDKNIGNVVGVLTYITTEKIGGKPTYYSENTGAIEDVRAGRIDGFMHALSTVRVIASQPGNENFEAIEVPPRFFSAQIAAFSNSQEELDRFNKFLEVIKADGTLADMQERWFGEGLNLDAKMPEFKNSGKNGVIKNAINSEALPYAYMGKNNEFNGFSIELALRFGEYEQKKVEFIDMEFGALIPYIISGKADISIANVAVTEERKKSVKFSNPFFDELHGVLTLKNGNKQTSEKPIRDSVSYLDFIGKRFGVKNGTVYDYISTDILKSSNTMLFEDYPSIYEAVLKNRVDAGMRGYYAAYVSLFDSEYSNLAVIALPDSIHINPIGAISINQSTIDDFNKFLAKIRADGIYREMKSRWFDTFNPKNMPTMPEIPLTKENGKITVAISSDYMPFSFIGDNGVNLGFDIELATRFAAYMNKDVEFVDMAFSGLLPYVMSGKADIAISDINITDERKKSVLFSEPYFTDFSAIVYKKADNIITKADTVSQTAEKEVEEAKKENAFIAWLKTGIERNLITDNRWKMITNGLGVTMLIAISAQFFGTILGGFLCYLLLRKNKFVNWIANRYCGLINGTPVVVLLMITYYIIFGSVDISNVLVAIAAFTLVMSAIIAQTLKGSIETVDIVEIEAARSIGFSAFKAFTTVTLPQAIRRALPSYTSSFVELVKSTAIVGYIAIQDLTRAGDIIRSRTYDAYFPLILVAVIYLIVTAICVWIFKYLIKKVNGGAEA